MAAFLIGHMTITDRENYMRYRSEFFPIFESAGGELVAFDDDATVLEGHLDPGRTVILKFPSREAALDWWTSEDYQRISQFRRAGVKQHFVTLIEDKPRHDQFT